MATVSLCMTRGNPALEALPVVMICLLCITIHDYLVFDRFYSNMVKYSFISMFDVLLYLLESSWAIQIHDMIYLAIYLIHMIFYFDPFKYIVSLGVLVNSNTYMIYLSISNT